MDLKKTLKQLLPFLFLKPRMEYVAGGWPEIAANYNQDVFVQKQIKKYRRLVSETGDWTGPKDVFEEHEFQAAQLAALRAGWGQDSIKILDFGGALGVYYQAIKQAFPNNFPIRYDVVELPKICEAGRHINAKVNFVQTIPRENYDLVIASGALQYVPDWQGLLADFGAAEFLFLPRTPLTQGRNFMVKDFYGGKDAPLFFEVRNSEDTKSFIQSLGFRLVAKSISAPFPPVKNAPTPIFYVNWLFKK